MVHDRSATLSSVAPVVVPATGAWAMVVLLTAAYALAMVDRTVLVLLIGPLQTDLGLDDTQFGLLQGVTFALFYVVAGLPIGALVDRMSRIRIITIGLIVWSGATMLSALATGFGGLFVARTGVAVGEAALNPAAYSLLSNSFSRATLGRAIGIFSTGAAIGTGLAYIVGGALLALLAGRTAIDVPLLGALRVWQVAFIVAGAPGIVLAVLISRLQEPVRPFDSARPVLAGLRPSWLVFFAANRAALLAVFGATACQTLMLYAFMTWAPALLLRDHGLPGGQVGLILGLVSCVFGISGFVTCGLVADRWWKAGRADAHARVGFWAHCAILPLGLVAALASQLWIVIPALGFLTFLQLGTGPAVIAGLQLMTPPELRGRTSAILIMVATLSGVGLGPLVVGLLNDRVFGTQNVGHSLAAVVGIVAPLAIVLFAVARPLLARAIVKLQP